MATGAAVIPAPGSGSFRKEYCPSHMQVEWELSYTALHQCEDALRSPVFKIEKQSYMLELKRETTDDVELSLLRMGPSVSQGSFTGQYWAGLKRTDGAIDRKFVSGRVDLRWEHESWAKESFLSIISKSNLDNMHLTSDGCLTLFFRMNIRRAPVGVETCTHGTPQTLLPEAGSIQQKACSRHQHVEWKISYGSQQDDAAKITSPVFKIGTQMYFFKLWTCNGIVSLYLFRLGSSVDGPGTVVRYWIGLKCRDGIYHPGNFSKKLDLSEDFGLWTPVTSHDFSPTDFKVRNLTLDQPLTFFFRMNVKPSGDELCTHGTSQVNPVAAGSIREEQCSAHKQVEWDVSCKFLNKRDIYLTSSVFKVGTQLYFLEACFRTHGGVDLHLFRLGRSVRGPASTPRCWVRLKCSDKTYRSKSFSTKLDLREEFGLWTQLDFLMRISRFDVERHYLTLDSHLIFLFRMNTETTRPQMCTHDSVEMPVSISGSIREEECSTYKQVNWDIDREVLRDHQLTLTSPVFKIGTQMFYMEMARGIIDNSLMSVYRLGKSAEGPTSFVRCWAGFKNLDGSYFLRSFSDKLDLREDCGLWTVALSLVIYHPLYFQEMYLKDMERLTFFFRVNVEQAGAEMCIHGPVGKNEPYDEGSIHEQECLSHKHVLWSVACEESRKEKCFSKSPVFKVENQWYFLFVNCSSKEPVTLELYRYGSPVQAPTSSIRCWAGLRRGDGSYHHHIQTAELDLHEDCSLPMNVASFVFPRRSDLEKTNVASNGCLTFFLQLNVPQSTTSEETCAHDAPQMCPPGEGSIREKNDKFVEWDVGYEAPRDYTHFSTSPVFKIGAQYYLLELCYETDGILSLSLYRFGRSVEGPARSVRCWAGLKRDRGLYHHSIKGVEFDLRRDCDLWTKVTILGYFSRYTLEKHELMRDGRLTFFFLISTDARRTNGFFDVAVQTDGNGKDGKLGNTSEHLEDFEKLREHFRLWLQHPEEGDRIRRLRMQEFESKRSKVLKKQLDEDKEPQIFVA